MPDDKLDAFAQYLIWGGMPLAVAEAKDRARAKYLQSLFPELYLSDIRKRYKLKDDYVLGCLVDVLASATGSLTNPHKLTNTIASVLRKHSSDHTVANYIECLEDAFLPKVGCQSKCP